MLLDLATLNAEELNEKLNTLNGRMKHLEMAGSHGSNAYAQCLNWMQQINYELEERNYMSMVEEDPDWKPGLVADIGHVPLGVIGEEIPEKDEKDGKGKSKYR